MAAVKQRLGFQPADIRVQAFESEEATIADLPGEYQQFLESPGSASPEEREHIPGEIAEWRAEGRSFLDWYVDYWLDADGEVITMVEAGRSGWPRNAEPLSWPTDLSENENPDTD